MPTRVQGSNLIADLPAEAARVIVAYLHSRIIIEARVATGVSSEASRDRALELMEIWDRQAAEIAHEAWHKAPETVVTVKLAARCWDVIMMKLERTHFQHGSGLVDETVDALKIAALRRDGMLADDGAIIMPDSP